MTYEDFKRHINGWIKASGIKSKVIFDPGEENKRYEAQLPDEGISMTAPHRGFSITVRFGSGHQAMVRAV